MKFTTLSALAGASIMAATSVQAANIDHILGNTVEISANNVTTTLLYQADGTIKNGSGADAGKWEVKGSDLCTTLQAPGGQGMQTACSPLAAVEATKVGDSWTFNPGGIDLTGTLVAGR